MPRVQESIHIERPVEDVFAFATTPENQTLISSNMIEFSADRAVMEKGTRAEGAIRVAGKKLEWTSEVTEFERNRRVEMRSIDSPIPFHITWEYEAEDGGTRVTFVQEADELGGFFGKLADPVVTKVYARDVKATLETLKILCEETEA